MKVVTFGYRYKRDKPVGADVVLDARCLKEDPAEKETLGKLTGLDDQVIKYLRDLPDVQRFTRAAISVGYEVPAKGTMAIACHSGRHRSVFVAEQLAKVLRCRVEHLDIDREPTEDNAPDFV